MNPSISQLRDKVRYATEPDNPQLIREWLDLEVRACGQMRRHQWQNRMVAIRLLLDTFADEVLPPHWRVICLDYIYLPLDGLHKLVKTEEDRWKINQLMYEIRTISEFFNPALAGTPNEECNYYEYTYRTR